MTEPSEYGDSLDNGNTGVEFSSGGTKLEKKCMKINIPIGKYWILRIGVVAICHKLGIILVIK